MKIFCSCIAALMLVFATIFTDCGTSYAWGRKPRQEIKTESQEPIQPQLEIISPPKEELKTEATLEGAIPENKNAARPQNGLEVQKALKNAGYSPGPLDGKIGPLTKKAIRLFQKNNGLEIDGIVGPKTWGKLRGFLKAKGGVGNVAQ